MSAELCVVALHALFPPFCPVICVLYCGASDVPGPLSVSVDDPGLSYGQQMRKSATVHSCLEVTAYTLQLGQEHFGLAVIKNKDFHFFYYHVAASNKQKLTNKKGKKPKVQPVIFDTHSTDYKWSSAIPKRYFSPNSQSDPLENLQGLQDHILGLLRKKEGALGPCSNILYRPKLVSIPVHCTLCALDW